MRTRVNIFWTGGLDSTYRICELSKLDVDIYPYYFCFPFRQNVKEELHAIERISAKIYNHPETRATLHPIHVVRMDEIDKNLEIEKSYNWVKEHTIVEFGLKRFPLQYMYLASFCSKYNLECEIGLEFEPHNRMLSAINKYGCLIKVEQDPISYFKLDINKSNSHIVTLLRYFHYPIPLFYMSKLDEIEGYKKLNMENVINDTWFCHHPIAGKPCGFCSPCRQVVAANMTYRLPKSAIWRHRFAYLFLLWTDKIRPFLKKKK